MRQPLLLAPPHEHSFEKTSQTGHLRAGALPLPSASRGRRFFALAAVALALASWSSAQACERTVSALYGMNPNAVVAQPDPPAVTATALATVDVGNDSGCGDNTCDDLSDLEIVVEPAAEGRFGYQFQILGAAPHPPALPEGPLKPLDEAERPRVIRVAWPSNDQYQSGPLRVQVRTINLLGEPGPWSEPFVVTPDKGRSGGVLGFGLLAAVLLATRPRRRLTPR